MKEKAALSLAGDERRVGLTKQPTTTILPASNASSANINLRLLACERDYADAATYAEALHGNANGCTARFVQIVDAQVKEHIVPAENAGRIAAEYAGRENVFVEVNSGREVFGKRVRAGIRTIHLDLDFYNTTRWAESGAEVVLAAFVADLDAAGIPRPQLSVATGRGLQVVWLLEPALNQAQPKARKTMRKLVERFSAFGADPACIDQSRIFRLPGTINSKNGARVRLLCADVPPVRYSLDAISDAILGPKPAKRPKINIKRGAKAKRAANVALAMHRLNDLRRLAMGRGKIRKGHRDTFAHIAAVHIIQLPRDAEQNLREFCGKWIDGPTEEMIRAKIRSAQRRRYRYTGVLIGQKLDVTCDEAARFGLRSIYPATFTWADVRAQQKALDAEAAMERRRAAGARPQANSARKRQPWKAAYMSRSTYYAHKAKGPLVETKAEQPGRTISSALHRVSSEAGRGQGSAEGEPHVASGVVETGAGAPAQALASLKVEANGVEKSAAPKIGPAIDPQKISARSSEHRRPTQPSFMWMCDSEREAIHAGMADLIQYESGIMPRPVLLLVRDYRRRHLITQDQMARALGISRCQLANVEQGRFGLGHEPAARLRDIVTGAVRMAA